MPDPCRTCRAPLEPGDQFCVGCGTPAGPLHHMAHQAQHRPVQPVPRLDPIPGPRRPAPRSGVDARDETTRYLCAAAQLDAQFADDAIAEYLVEPVRAIPPTPGLNAAAVLYEALAARARRRLRDVVLLVLLGLLCLIKSSWVLLWLLPALLVAASAKGVHRRGPSGAAGLVISLLVVGAVIYGLALLRTLWFAFDPYGVWSLYSTTAATEDVLTFLGSLLVVAILGVLAVDEFIVHHLVHTCFRPGRFRPDATAVAPGWERSARTLGQRWEFARELRRVADADDAHAPDPYRPAHADVVVHRGFGPFVGAGDPVFRQVIALPLDPDDEEPRSERRPISVTQLHASVAEALAALRSGSSLGPGQRLERLTRRELILVPAERLVRNLDQQTVPAILPDTGAPPISRMALHDARAIAESPQEWARYYQCFRVETWDRDLTMSCYLHAGTDQHMLFLEWTFCMLPPIREAYRHIDRFSDPVDALKSALLQAAMFPATVPARVRALRHRFRPIEQRAEEIVPDRYGADRSLRELAAARDPQTYFQFVDVQRYVKILDKAVVRAVGAYLQDNGYSVVEFQRMAVAPTYDMRGSNVFGNTFGRNSPLNGTVQGGPGEPGDSGRDREKR